MKLGDVQLLKREDIPDLKGEGIDKILLALNTNTQTLRDVLGGGFTLEDNAGAKFMTVKCTHGVETFIKNPFAPQIPKAVLVTGYDGPLQMLGDPLWRRVNSESQPDVLGLKVAFDLAHTQPYLEKYLSSNFSVNNNVDTTVIWDTTGTSRGSVISYNAGSGVFTVSEAGTYQIGTTIPWQTAVTYTAAQTYIRIISGTAAGYSANFLTDGMTYLAAPFTDGAWLNASAQIRLLAGATFDIRAYQTNAAAVARLIRGTAASSVTPGYMSIGRSYNDTVPIANVTFLMVRG